ncbi:Amino-acid acetyltransferase, mitochondrial [Teratosphaeriaceae sp. CCFEE 6253]|nr:Amino-acid acetyltransferase, mitochondrial [Teratosphaeriaceae sp. CCFEE 6253]
MVNCNIKPTRQAEDSAAQRELFMDVLSANATKRDAKQYLARFQPPKSKAANVQRERNARYRNDQERLDRMGVNLGGLYTPARAIADAPRFEREIVVEKASTTVQSELHVALVCLRVPESLEDDILDGLATTLSQLVKLDMRIVIVLELGGHSPDRPIRTRRAETAAQAERLSQAIRMHSAEGCRLVTGSLEQDDGGKVNVFVPRLIIDPLKRGMIPVIPALAHTQTGQLVKADLEGVMAGLTQALSVDARVVEQSRSDGEAVSISLDRVIILDAAGGIPAKHRSDNAHVFINLEQEYAGIQRELLQYASWDDTISRPNMYDQHTENLAVLKQCLRMLPPASSGLIISPYEAATSSQASQSQDSATGAGTRRQKNTLIHNLLTNKPMVSSSLPIARHSGDAAPAAHPTATLVKRGMPVSIIPSIHRGQGWHVPPTGTAPLDLGTDSQVDLPRLVHLINNSFRRELDTSHYLSRIQNRTAGLIVAGSYEGAAILTWEQPPGTTSPTRLVPYLDKFAVLQSSQGSSGVADILFQAMVRSCFPKGVCWRSRSDNPVNKWYFERAAGSWRIPGSNWTMFWTGEGVVEGGERWGDYVGVCRAVVPSWVDGKKPD